MTRETFLPFALPDTDEAELQEIAEALHSGWLTTGPKVRKLEEEFAKAVGASHAVAVNSCTAAMHLALEAIGLKPGDEVITTPYTFAATAEVVRYFGAKPVLVDIDSRTLNINPNRVEAAITARSRVVMPVDIAGLAADLDPILDIARRNSLRVIEDAAHAFPSRYKGRPIGSVSGITCFSFYATKTITTGEGGMITTDDPEVADRCRLMSLHGISQHAWNRYAAEGSWRYEIVAPGFKYNMTDIAAAMGLAQLRKAERMWARRSGIARRYDEAFRGSPCLEIPAHAGKGGRHAWHLYVLRLNGETLEIDRALFIEELKKRNIGASVHFIPLHLHPYYRETYGFRPEDFPVAYAQFGRAISLPIYSKMTESDVEDVICAVLDIVESNHRK